MFLPRHLRREPTTSEEATSSIPNSTSAPPSASATTNTFQNPGLIPPRTSSTSHQSYAHKHGYSHSYSPPSNPFGPPPPSRSALGDAAGADVDWPAQRLKHPPLHRSQPSQQSMAHFTSSAHSIHNAAAYDRQRSRKNSTANSSTSFPVTMAPAQQPPAPPDPARYAYEDLSGLSKKPWPEEKEKVVRGPFDYLYAQPGKDFRSSLVKAFNAWLEVPPDSIEIINKVIGMLHTASLLIDDVEDSSSLRRSLPVAHNIFGMAQTINSANYVYMQALQELQLLRNQKALTIYADELVNLHRGQGMDLFWRDTLTCPTEDDYLEMVSNKTGGLFRIGIRLMQAESRSLMDCVPLVNLIGLIYQIRDDYMNLSSSEYSQNKGMCEDLTEGKFSFPIIHSIRSDPSNKQLLNILGQKTTDHDVKRYAVSYMERSGSFEYTCRVVNVLVARARKLAFEMDEGRGKTEGIFNILDKMQIN